jgi:hypothetical protein
MSANHHKAVMELFRSSDHDEETTRRVLETYGMTPDELRAAMDEVFSGNDVEGAALEIAALDSTFPDWEAHDDVYLEATARIMDERCPLLRLYHDEPGFPEWLEFNAEEMMTVIFDGAERIGAAVPLAV